jgi:hypothetical protein
VGFEFVYSLIGMENNGLHVGEDGRAMICGLRFARLELDGFGIECSE